MRLIEQMPTGVAHLEQRSHEHMDTENITSMHNAAIATGQQLTYAAVAAKPYELTTTTYKPATFNNCPYPFEGIPHLLITERYSGATLPRNEIVFRHIFERGHATTREVLQACRAFAT